MPLIAACGIFRDKNFNENTKPIAIVNIRTTLNIVLIIFNLALKWYIFTIFLKI